MPNKKTKNKKTIKPEKVSKTKKVIQKTKKTVKASVKKKKLLPLGGMAFPNGLMMRTPNHMSVAIRDSVGRIEMASFNIKDYKDEFSLFYFPFVRGIVFLVENLYFLAKLSLYRKRIEKRELKEKTKIQRITRKGNKYLVASVYILFFLAIFNFVYNRLTSYAVVNWENFFYNFLLTIFCVMFFAAIYLIFLISQQEKLEMLEYHATEHKIINAYEKTGKVDEKTLGMASTIHSRCSVFVVFWSIIVFSLLISGLHVGVYSWFWGFIVSIGLVFISFAIAYEFVRFIVTRKTKLLFDIFLRPLYLFQVFSVHEPDEKHINLGMIVFNEIMRVEKNG